MSGALVLVLTAAGLAGGAYVLEKRDRRNAGKRVIASASAPRIIELSNFAAEQQGVLANAREEVHQRAVYAHEARLQRRSKNMMAGAVALKKAWDERRLLAAVTAASGWLVAAVSWSIAPRKAPAGLQEQLWAVGQEGEAVLTHALTARFDAAWTIIAGFRNWKGEIDRLLVGPGGVFAFEVKHHSGRIHCSGDTWWRDKEDRYGNTVEWGLTIADRGGRGPSRQLNEPTDQLQRALQNVVPGLAVKRIVVFTNDRASFGDLMNSTVNFVATIGELDMGYIVKCAETILVPEELKSVLEAVRRQHEARQAAKKQSSK